jgi:hypothetical protein
MCCVYWKPLHAYLVPRCSIPATSCVDTNRVSVDALSGSWRLAAKTYRKKNHFVKHVFVKHRLQPLFLGAEEEEEEEDEEPAASDAEEEQKAPAVS